MLHFFVQVPRDPEDPEGAERQKEEQKLIDESEPLTEEEIEEKESLLQEVREEIGDMISGLI